METSRYNLRLRPSAVRETGNARARRGRAASLGPPGPNTAPAVEKTLAAPADVKETVSTETSLTDISDSSFQTTSEEMLEEIKTEVTTSDSDTLDGYNIDRQVAIPSPIKTNLQEKDRVTDRQITPEEEDPNDGPTHRNKGKGPDPLEWGAVQLSNEELDPETQCQIIQACSIRRDGPLITRDPDPETSATNGKEQDLSDHRNSQVTREELRERLRQKRALNEDIRQLKKALRGDTRKKCKTKRSGSEPISEELRDMIGRVTQRVREAKRPEGKEGPVRRLKPVNQISRDSALGRAFDRMRSEEDSGSSESPSSESSYPSDSSDDPSSESDDNTSRSSGRDDSSGESSTSSSDEDGSNRKVKFREKVSRGKGKKSKKRVPRSLIKPTPPSKYGGAPDLQAFLQFMTHCTSYVKYGLVQKECQVLVVSEFLTGRAWTFYSREVSRAPEVWSMERFFKELFNDCFPINYRNKQRYKLQHLRQGKMTVRDYVGELQELFPIVGSTNSKEKVVKLFNGFRTSIQWELYRMGLNPETSRWKKVVSKAEFVEMAESVDLDYDNPGAGCHPSRQDKRSEGGRGFQTHRERRGKGHLHHNLGRKRSKSPSSYGKKTNSSPAYSAKQGTSRTQESSRVKGSYKSQRPKERKRLTKEEEEQFRAQDRCFNCGESGHFARNCPKNKSASALRPGKPTGVKSYSMRLDLREADQLREEALGQTTEGLSVGMVLIETLSQAAMDQSTHPPSQGALGEDAGDYYDPVELIPPWEFGEDENPIQVSNSEEKLMLVYGEERKFGRPRCLGNALERRLDHDLEWLQPYPGNPENILQYRGRQFTSTQTEEGLIHTWDAVWEREATIPCKWVANPSFEVGTWYGLEQSIESGAPLSRSSWYSPTLLTDMWVWNAGKVLELGSPYLPSEDKIYHKIQPRFRVVREGLGTCLVVDRQIRFVASIRAEHLENPQFDICGWYAKRVKHAFPNADSSIWEEDKPFDLCCTVAAGSETPISQEELMGKGDEKDPTLGRSEEISTLELCGQQVKQETYPAIQRNNGQAKNINRKVPKPLVIVVKLDGHPVCALLDSGSLGDFVSTTTVEQLKLRRVELSEPVPVQLAVQGSRSRNNYGAMEC
ncbi:hypothetical protein E4T56_gene4559 [Termitomyces sp. T112]|nr:hypothetical protein E4T56_gene4559 [Termitomyces sp. T112]